MRWIWHTALAGTLLVGSISGCGRSVGGAIVEGAVTALPALLPISDQQEQAIGLEAAQQVVAQVPVLQDQNIQAYVQTLGNQMAAKSERANIPYTFTVLAAQEPDAFALPGGFIFITAGMLTLMENEAQLAGVLAHEVGHVAARHSVEMIRQAAVAQGVQVAALGTDAGVSQVIGNVIRELVLRGYGREKELEADRLGATYASAQGYAPAQLTGFLQRLESASGGGGGGGESWTAPLSTHPPVSQRVSQLDAYIREQGLTGSNLNAEGFQRATAPLRR